MTWSTMASFLFWTGQEGITKFTVTSAGRYTPLDEPEYVAVTVCRANIKSHYCSACISRQRSCVPDECSSPRAALDHDPYNPRGQFRHMQTERSGASSRRKRPGPTAKLGTRPPIAHEAKLGTSPDQARHS